MLRGSLSVKEKKNIDLLSHLRFSLKLKNLHGVKNMEVTKSYFILLIIVIFQVFCMMNDG